MPSNQTFKLGSLVTWTASGGSLVMGMNTLGIGAGRAGAEKNWQTGVLFLTHLFISLEVTMNVAPAAGTFVELYWLSSYVTAKYSGGFTAADEVFTDAELRQQCLHVGNMKMNASTTLQRFNRTIINPGPFGKPGVFNATDQTFVATTNTSRVLVTPFTIEGS